jgi:hypothetical protein
MSEPCDAKQNRRNTFSLLRVLVGVFIGVAVLACLIGPPVISPAGAVMEACDHMREGPGVVVADVPVYGVRTIFSRFGHWFVAASGLFLALYVGFFADNYLKLGARDRV